MCQGASATATNDGSGAFSLPATAYAGTVPVGSAPTPGTSDPIESATATGATSLLPAYMYLHMSNNGTCTATNSTNTVAHLDVAPNTGTATAEAAYESTLVPVT
jgi:hypothetical protein